MKKKLLSAILAGTLVLPTVVLPTSVGAEEANDSGTITVTYSPENYLIYYGTKYSGYYKYEYESMAITKNYIPKRQDNGAYAWPRTDQDKIYSQYKIMAPEAIVDVDINIQNMKLAMYKDVINNTITETGEVQTTESVREAVANFSLYYSTSMNDLPEGQEYGWYYTTQKDASTKTYVGGEAADVDALLSTWKSNLSSKTANPVLIETIVPSTFGVQTDKGIVRTETQTDGVTQSSKKNNAYETTNVSYDITDTVKQALVDGKNENGEVLFDVIYGAQKNGKNDYYVSDITKWYGDTTLTVTYDKDLIAADVNSAETFDELVAKVKFYASLLGVDVTKFNDAVLAEKLPQYVGTTFTGESFEALLENLKPVDITEYQVNISDLFNMSSWAYVGETVTDKSKMIAEGTHGSQRMSDSSKTSHTITDGDDTVTFNFDKERYHANVNNVFRGNVEDVFSIRNHARYAKNVYIVSTNFINHAGMYPITVKYTDGTSETKILETANKDQKSNGVMYNLLDSYVDYFWLGTRYGGITLETDETTGITTIGSTGAGDWGMLAWKFPVDSTKVIEEIIIENPKNVALELYAVAESVISNEEMRAYIANIEKLEAVTAENAAEVLVARKYADELKLRNVAVEADFEKLNELVEEVEWLAGRTDSKDIMYDLSSYFNRDYLAPKGSIMANGPVTYCGMHSEGYLKSNKNGYAEHTYNNGVQEVVEYNHKEVIGEDGTGTGKYTFEKTGETVKFKITPEMVSAGVNDTIEAIQGDTNIVIKANGNRVEKVYFLGDCPQMSTIGFIVNYKDGTSEKFSVKIAGWDWGIGSSANLAKKDSPYISGGLWFGYERYSIVTDDSGKLVMSSIPSRYTSVAMYGIELDATKQVESYELVPANGGDTYRAGIYALTEKTMSNDDMLAVIAEAEALLEEDAIGYVSTEENAKLVKTAAAYARELDERHAVKLEDNQLVLDLEEQAIAQEIKYLDLSAQADMDIIVKSGDTEKYASRDDSLLVDFDEYITAEERTDAEKAGWLPDPEAGTVYKLFGGWNGKGNDAVRVAPADEGGEGVVIDLNNEMYKHISFLVDSIDSAINAQTGATIYADVTYTDGETETVEITLRRGDSWYTKSRAAHYDKSFGSWNVAEGKYVNTGWVTGGNSNEEYKTAYPGRSGEGVAVFGFDIPSQKTVASVKLNAHEKAEYAIIAVTATPYTNDWLYEKVEAFGMLGISTVEEVTAENAAIIVDGYRAATEFYNRNYSGMDESTLAMFEPLYIEALKHDIEDDVLSFVPSISVENGNVTAEVSMVNTTEFGQDYILIIAAYDANNQLVGVKSADQATLASMTYAAEDSVTMAVPANATKYKALVWESKDSMDPLAMLEK